MSSTRVALDFSRSLATDPRWGHNRWHPDIEPVAEVDPGAIIEVDMRDGLDVQIFPESPIEDLVNLDVRRGHPMTGPFFVRGAEPGDVVEVSIIEIRPEDFGYTAIVPGLGLLTHRFSEPYLVKWNIRDGVARSEQIPGVAITGQAFLGVVGVAPSHESLARYLKRESTLAETGVLVLPPDPISCVPSTGRVPEEGLRTAPPRENGGNMDIRQLGEGSAVRLPVDVSGALVSMGDTHFAQGDGESCGVAIEVSAHARVKIDLRKAADLKWSSAYPSYEFTESQSQPRRFFATTGIPIARDGTNRFLDVELAAANALDELVDYLVGERGFSKEQAYIIVSVASDLRISSIVNVPNALVSAILPLDIFEAESR